MHDMKQFLQLVKQAAIEAIDARKPCDVMFAKVESISPVAVSLENMLLLPEELLVFIEGVKDKLSVGCRVILLRKSGGQQYVVLGVVL